MIREDKVKEIQNILDFVGEDKVKKLCVEAFIDGLEKGLKINKNLKSA